MFQFDAGTFTDTINTYGSDVLTSPARPRTRSTTRPTWSRSRRTRPTPRPTTRRARGSTASIRTTPTLRDQWITTVVRYYNGCQPGWSCWSARYQTYSDGYHARDRRARRRSRSGRERRHAAAEARRSSVGEIEKKYHALGGCSSVLGVPTTDEQGTPDGVGRYSVFEQRLDLLDAAARRVRGPRRDPRRVGRVGWEAGIARLSDHRRDRRRRTASAATTCSSTARSTGRPQTGAHEVTAASATRGQPRLGGRRARLPDLDEYAVTGGRRSDFQHGSITWIAYRQTRSRRPDGP